MNKVLFGIGALVYALVLGVVVVKAPPLLALMLAGLPLVALVLPSRSLFLLLPIATIESGLYVPGIPANFQLYHLLCAAFVGLNVVNECVRRRKSERYVHCDQLAVLFLITWVVLLMLFRGTGMRILGGSQFGGAVYLQVLVVLLFYLHSRNQTAAIPHIQIAGLLMGALSILPMLANGLFELSGGAVWYQMLVFKTGAAAGQTVSALTMGEETRFTFLSFGAAFIWLGVFANRSGKPFIVLHLVYWPLSLLFALLSGYRATVIITLGFIYGYCLVMIKRRGPYLFATASLAVVAYLFLMSVVHYLPFPVQRILSSLPGMEAEWQAAMQAKGTLIWRQLVWELALEDLNRYWLFGRGVTFNPDWIPFADRGRSTPYVAYTTGSFHNATLELLILYGAPALTACLAFYADVFRKCARMFLKRNWNHPGLYNWAMSLFLYIVVRVALAFAGGTSGELLSEVPLLVAFLYIIYNTDRQQPEAE